MTPKTGSVRTASSSSRSIPSSKASIGITSGRVSRSLLLWCWSMTLNLNDFKASTRKRRANCFLWKPRICSDFCFTVEPPFVPEVSCATDTSNFDLDDDPRKREELYVAASVRDFKGYHLPFIGFTYTKNRWVCSPEASRWTEWEFEGGGGWRTIDGHDVAAGVS